MAAGCTIIPAADPASTPPRASDPVSPHVDVSAGEPSPSYAQLGQTVMVGPLRVTPLKVLEDSRCPMNARCIWAGQVRLRIRTQQNGTTQSLEITSGKALSVHGGALELTEIQPDKVTGENRGAIDSSDYRFGFGFISGL